MFLCVVIRTNEKENVGMFHSHSMFERNNRKFNNDTVIVSHRLTFNSIGDGDF